jgi:hypothetical protein
MSGFVHFDDVFTRAYSRVPARRAHSCTVASSHKSYRFAREYSTRRPAGSFVVVTATANPSSLRCELAVSGWHDSAVISALTESRSAACRASGALAGRE